MRIKPFVASAAAIMLCCSCANNSGTNSEQPADEYYVAAYIWPSCHDDAMGRDTLWAEGTGEWEVIKKGNPRFEGHYQPKVPLWGYEMDDDPKVMEKWINTATAYGINTFIFDWYWFDGRDYLESCVNAFADAPNSEKMHFYLMWANHDVVHNYWNYHRYNDNDTQLWHGEVDMDNFKKIVDRVINKYFQRPNYFKIDGCPVFSIFSIYELIESFGTVEETGKALEYFRDEVKKAGFPDLHIQLIALDGPAHAERLNFIKELGINSVTKYNWGGPYDGAQYVAWGEKSMLNRESWAAALDTMGVQYYPNVSVGWDDTPRFPAKGYNDVIHNSTPESFAAYMQRTKDFVDKRGGVKLITINAWNEWVEGSYLLPDMKTGFGYLEAVKNVMDGNYDKYNVKNCAEQAPTDN